MAFLDKQFALFVVLMVVVDVNLTAVHDYAPEVELTIRVVKYHFRCSQITLTFKNLTGRMIIELGKNIPQE